MKDRFRFSDSVLTSQVDDELVLLDKGRGIYYGLNAMGHRMIALLLHHADADVVADLVCRDYEAPPERVRGDLRGLVTDLLDRGLLSAQS